MINRSGLLLSTLQYVFFVDTCGLLSQGQARGIWTYHLKKAQYHEGPLFLRPHCGQTSEHTSYSKVSNERYVHYLSNDTP